MNNKPDISVKIRMKSTNSGGRKGPTPDDLFKCIFIYNDKKYDCCLKLRDVGALCPGNLYEEIPIEFLVPDSIVPSLKIGSLFALSDGRKYADGEVIKIG